MKQLIQGVLSPSPLFLGKVIPELEKKGGNIWGKGKNGEIGNNVTFLLKFGEKIFNMGDKIYMCGLDFPSF